VSTTPRIHWRFTVEGGPGQPALLDAERWLSSDERARLSALRVEKRRRDWLLGRLNAKALLTGLIETATGGRPEPAEIEIARHASGAPFVRLCPDARPTGPYEPGVRLPLVVSNTHSAGHALFAAAWTDRASPASFTLGVDLEWVEPRSAGFIRDFLTPIERRFCEREDGARRDLRANLVWSAKESVLKAVRRGLTADTYWLTCLPTAYAAESEPDLVGSSPWLAWSDLEPPDPAWQGLAVGALDPRLGVDGLSFGGLWRTMDGFVATLVVGR